MYDWKKRGRKMLSYSVFLPSYSVGEDCYQQIPYVTRKYGKTAVVIGGKTAMEKARQELDAAATYVGYTVGAQAGDNPFFGILGSAIATFAVCLPSLTVMLVLTRFFLRLKGNAVLAGAMSGMKPVVIGMIASAALLLMFPASHEGESFIDGWSWAIFGLCVVASARKVNPILLILLSAAAGIVIYHPFC